MKPSSTARRSLPSAERPAVRRVSLENRLVGRERARGVLQPPFEDLAETDLQRQFRLSVTPITPDEWRIIREMGGDEA